MERETGDPLALAACPVCYEGIRLRGSIYVGRQVVCPDCGACLVVVQGDPDMETGAEQPRWPGRLTSQRARERYVTYSGVRAVGHLGE